MQLKMVNPGEDSDFEHSFSEENEDTNDEQYAKLHASVSQLDSTQRIRSAKRNELGSLISEFHVKEAIPNAAIQTQELASVLNEKKVKTKINKKINKVAQIGKALRKPLEKPVAEQIKRRIGFEIVKEQLKSWEPVVENYRSADHLVFPLNQPNFFIQDKNELAISATQTPLEKELNAVLHGEQPEQKQEENDEFPLTLEEMIERRKELASIRARQSYKEAKAYRQSKIKSKKYHRIQKREKVKLQIKEFELLQKTDPEAALKKLEELEKSRAEERATLRHRSTGKWAKNLSVRAKYDKESRKVLAEQLSISRDMTQKAQAVDSSDDEREPDPTVLKSALEIAESNPWALEVSSDVNSFISGFRRYWSEKTGKPHESNVKRDVVRHDEVKEIESKELGNKENQKIRLGACGKWVVTTVVPDSAPLKRKIADFDLDEAFYLADQKLASKISKKFKVLKDKIKPAPVSFTKTGRNKKKKEPSLKMTKSRWHVEKVQVDQELGDTRLEEEERNTITSRTSAVKYAKEEIVQNPSQINIDPEKFLKLTPKTVKTLLPEEVAVGDDDAIDDDDEDDDKQQQVIMEAFAEDNVTDFKKTKEEAEKETQPEVVTELPGWGAWGGVGVKPSKRRRRLFLKMPELPKRKDHGLPDVIINEDANPHIKNHMVKEVPFPFKSVSAFESNIRTPVSREWVPETAHRDLIRPAIITKQGTIIEPMSDDVLIRNRPKPRSVFKKKSKTKSAK